jgi:hypothetical protein
MVLVGCGSNAEPKSATAESAKAEDGSYAKVTVEVTDGKITAIDMDEISGDQSKKELGEDYGMAVASKIGDDYLQKKAQGYEVPESFNHGRSAQRKAWLKKGLTTGDPSKGDTFSPAYEDL